ncbi:hypothetical protein Pmani_019000 [Petrolisthes manimaculis]|uniref:Uncharacterized protein n=1 Tax=Petrolisthes manimaculis TaxID=1843537 RepID=A0AAE1PKF2_9EUCA|nr:hypothetical protein Pmani_019000 [Petrolisthes manimaculis]
MMIEGIVNIGKFWDPHFDIHFCYKPNMKWSVLFVLGVLAWGNTLATMVPKEATFYQLDCPKEGTLQYFMLKRSGQAMMVDNTYKVMEQNITIHSNGSIIFHSLKVEFEGTHLCVMNHPDNSIHGHEVKLRVRPLPPTDLWGAVYESMFVTGLIAALVIAFIFALGCFVYKKQWRPRPEDEKPVMSGYENPAMNPSDDGESGSTNM